MEYKDIIKQQKIYADKISTLGSNLQTIAKKLGSNQRLLRYLYYQDAEPLSPNKPNVTLKQVMHDQIRIVPLIEHKDDSTSILSIRVGKISPDDFNPSFAKVYFDIESFIPVTKWIIKDDNVRSLAIVQEVVSTLVGTEIEGLGTIVWESTSLNFLTEEMSAYSSLFSFTEFR